MRYEYTIHREEDGHGHGQPPEFSWSYGPWSQCTVTCGTGEERGGRGARLQPPAGCLRAALGPPCPERGRRQPCPWVLQGRGRHRTGHVLSAQCVSAAGTLSPETRRLPLPWFSLLSRPLTGASVPRRPPDPRPRSLPWAPSSTSCCRWALRLLPGRPRAWCSLAAAPGGASQGGWGGGGGEVGRREPGPPACPHPRSEPLGPVACSPRALISSNCRRRVKVSLTPCSPGLVTPGAPQCPGISASGVWDRRLLVPF